MPPQPLASFASAAASNGPSEAASSSGRLGGSGGGDWSRPRANGATATFRRSSQATSNTAARDNLQQTPPAASASSAYVPPHASASFQSSSRPIANDLKYSKEQLLDVFKGLLHPGDGGTGLSDVLTEGWAPGALAATGSAGWSRRDDQKEGHIGPDVCWDSTASVKPLGLIEMDEEEKELFLTSVNSPLKPPPQNPTKEGAPNLGINGRKSSISQGTAGHGPAVPAGRPGARRRETSDTVPANPLASPTSFNRPLRDDGHISTPPPSLMRRRTDFKDVGSAEKKIDTSLEANSPFGSFKRSTTGPLSAGLNGPSSPWATGPQSAGFGAFGNFAIDNSAQPSTPAEKKFGFGSLRGESRFKGLMSKDSSEDIGSRSKEKTGLSLLERLGENDTDMQSSKWSQSTGKDLSQAGEQRVGSAALGGDDSSLDQRHNQDEFGFSGIGRDAKPQDSSQAHIGRGFSDSPTGTNPYQSPEGGVSQEIPNEADDEDNSYGVRGGDRSQTTSANQNRGFGGLQSFGNIGLSTPGGWSATPGSIGPTSRTTSNTFHQAGYQESVFGPMGEVSSPGGMLGGQPNTFGAIGRGTGRMSSLFPNQMQEQIRNDHGFGDLGQGRGNGVGAFGGPARDTDSPSRNMRSAGPLDELFGGAFDNRQRPGPGVSSPFAQEPLQRPDSGAPSAPQSQPVGGNTGAENSSPNSQTQDPQMPAAQKRQMVMPDRMRWIYRDPTGQTQGPWSGLEMHDWYKAGFFSPELLVKKQEDPEYEPLAQLIRRIGNSREPFLVPQIGIPHGPPTTQPGGSSLGLGGTGIQSGAAQPPFPSSFPSFGTTLTAQQQNDLERRKQEEQFLMARQKEQLAAHQAMMRSMQMTGMHHPQALNHHSSAQSLHSQPSFGSMTSPTSYQPAPGQGNAPHSGMPGFFDRPGHGFGSFPGEPLPGREAELPGGLDRLNIGRSTHSPHGNVPQQSQDVSHHHQVVSMLQDRARLIREQEQADGPSQVEDMESQERLQQFQQLRGQESTISSPPPAVGQASAQEKSDLQSMASMDSTPVEPHDEVLAQASELSIPKQEQAPTQPQSVAPPPPSISPLPAPAAQRNRQHVAENLVADSRSRSQTPSVETPTAALAPWAKESIEATRGPSLKEIQEAEARKAAQIEEAAAARRQQVAEQERVMAAQAQQPVVGLPSGANWAANPSPTAATNAPAWAKKTAVATPAATGKKTLAQIQKEEEARKTRAAAAAAAAINTSGVAPTTNAAVGKRYADLASKVSTASGPSGGGAWTTVGASGKAKVPVGPSGAAPQRTLSGSAATAMTTAKPKAPTPVRSNTATTGAQHAQDEFQKWAKAALGKGLNAGINVDEFVRSLMQFPAEPEMLSDAVYASSQTLDGRRFADEFIRRRRNADKGIPPEANASSNFAPGVNDNKSSGGWSEVAKKGPVQQQEKDPGNGAFKVVAAKKKGKR